MGVFDIVCVSRGNFAFQTPQNNFAGPIIQNKQKLGQLKKLKLLADVRQKGNKRGYFCVVIVLTLLSVDNLLVMNM